MKHLLSIAIAAFLALGLMLQDAEAARLGGGRSMGAQRSSVAPNRSVQPTPPSKAAPTAPAAAPQPAGNRWLGPIAGLAAGLGLGWLLGQGGMGGLGSMLSSVLMMGLVAFAAFGLDSFAFASAFASGGVFGFKVVRYILICPASSIRIVPAGVVVG